jgi:hypothetical protein
MTATARLRQLDRRAEAWGRRFQREYDTEPPWWMKYGGFVFVLLGPASIPVSLATSPVFTMLLLVSLLALYAAVVAVWLARHRT